MKIELKHLAPYLPYGLKILVHDDFEMEMTHKRIQDSFEDDLEFISVEGVLEDHYCKPILRPLSDLTKEIEVNGEKFVPSVIINNTSKIWATFNFYKINTDNVIMLPYDAVEKLFEWHFDVFGLIEKGLAISVHDVGKADA